MTDSTQRRPKPQYNEQNGFTERVIWKMSGVVPPARCNLHAVAIHPEKASAEDLRELRAAVQRRQLAEDVMELQGDFFPGLDAIKKANEAPETSATLKERIQEKQKRHIQDVRTMYQWQAQDYYDEMLDLTRSKPDINDPGVEGFYANCRSNFDIAASFDDTLDRINYAHLNSIIPLMKEQNAHRQREELEQRRRDMVFPQSVAEFNAIRSKDIQVRVAKFLTANETVRDRMMDEYKWAYRQVLPLSTEFQRTDSFKAEVQALLREIQTQDPRKARRNPQATVKAS
ncbi:hypothetical protein C2E23DRAFT_870340 [Lenzites betulinus]|nr:hypothetical protein C2E23DRAFT_870340 [Lenzites betulinus]